MLAIAEDAKAMGLTTREVGGLAGYFSRRALTYNFSSEDNPLGDVTTMHKRISCNTNVYRCGECIDGMITDGLISADALVYAFETHAGPAGDSPGILRQRLMWRHEDGMGGGDAARDASTKAKLDGGISDYTWDKHIVPGYEHLQNILTWRHPLTESADMANRRRAAMVPYMQCVIWSVDKQKGQYPSGRTILIVKLLPMLREFVMRFLPMG